LSMTPLFSILVLVYHIKHPLSIPRRTSGLRHKRGFVDFSFFLCYNIVDIDQQYKEGKHE